MSRGRFRNTTNYSVGPDAKMIFNDCKIQLEHHTGVSRIRYWCLGKFQLGIFNVLARTIRCFSGQFWALFKLSSLTAANCFEEVVWCLYNVIKWTRKGRFFVDFFFQSGVEVTQVFNFSQALHCNLLLHVTKREPGIQTIWMVGL